MTIDLDAIAAKAEVLINQSAEWWSKSYVAAESLVAEWAEFGHRSVPELVAEVRRLQREWDRLNDLRVDAVAEAHEARERVERLERDLTTLADTASAYRVERDEARERIAELVDDCVALASAIGDQSRKLLEDNPALAERVRQRGRDLETKYGDTIRRKLIEDRIDLWHERQQCTASLHEFLGWTWPEYKKWVEEDVLPEQRKGAY